MPINRRSLLLSGTAFAAIATLPLVTRLGPQSRAAEGTFEIEKTEAEWRGQLNDFEFAVLREEATERPWTSPLLDEKRPGIFRARAATCRSSTPRRNTKAERAGPASGSPRQCHRRVR